jgi:hypothetical protein
MLCTLTSFRNEVEQQCIALRLLLLQQRLNSKSSAKSVFEIANASELALLNGKVSS